MKNYEVIVVKIEQSGIKKQLRDALLVIKKMSDQKLADRLLYDVSLCHIGDGYLNYKKKFLSRLCISNPEVAKCKDSLDFIGYLLADRLDRNNLFQNVIDNVYAQNPVNTFQELEELQNNTKLVIRKIFGELIKEHSSKREALGSQNDSDGSISYDIDSNSSKLCSSDKIMLSKFRA